MSKYTTKLTLDPLRGSVIGVEGIIGAGKTTFSTSIVEYLKRLGLKVKLFREYINHTLLKQYIDDMKKYSYMYQIMIFMKRLETYKKALKYAQSGGVSIIDRTSIGDYAFALMQKEEGNISPKEWEIYNKVIKEESTIKPTLIVNLDVEPKVAFHRMTSRGKKEEVSGYTLKYFDSLKGSYVKTYSLLCSQKGYLITFDWKDSPRRVVNTEGKLSDSVCERILDKILSALV